ncbi:MULTISPECIES: hypothetical protein [Myxococcus]|uniref:hypothetical protein n=1 Tax=Myxococcus TaxID=32 RepID=UPI00129C1669|nr:MULTISPECIES: hypothetical protein [Myxococcus]MCK8500145.1 hypothetical protein [Myxococcus fulvus]
MKTPARMKVSSGPPRRTVSPHGVGLSGMAWARQTSEADATLQAAAVGFGFQP